MALAVITSNGAHIRQAIPAEINQNRIQTWALDGRGHLRHDTGSGQWLNAASLTCDITPSGLLFAIHKVNNATITPAVYGVYMGRLAEMLLAHFWVHIGEIQITPTPDPNLGDEQ